MMKAFNGFSRSIDVPDVSIPGSFFSELLPEIDHLGELKLTLYIFWRLERMEGPFYYILKDEILNDKIFVQGMGKNQRGAEKNINEALEQAVMRGVLLQADVINQSSKDNPQSLFFLNTPRGQAALIGLKSGEWQLPNLPETLVHLVNERPNIFQLYETHFGPLTPMIAEALREAEEEFPSEWLVDAVQIAVKNNVRKWRYVEAILERWKQEGRDERKDRPDSAEARERYFEELAKRIGR